MTGCLTILPVLIASALLKAWALVLLWTWFVTPTWGVSAPKYAVCLGLSAMWAVFDPSSTPPQDPTKSPLERLASSYTTSLLHAPLAIAFGWVVRHWM